MFPIARLFGILQCDRVNRDQRARGNTLSLKQNHVGTSVQVCVHETDLQLHYCVLTYFQVKQFVEEEKTKSGT